MISKILRALFPLFVVLTLAAALSCASRGNLAHAGAHLSSLFLLWICKL